MTTTLNEIAYENGLDLISTTSESNGYPSNIKEAIIGFDSFEEAQALADQYGLSIEHFQKRDGWDLWYRNGNNAYNDYELTAEDFGDNYMMFTKADLATYQQDEIDAFVNDYEDEEDRERFLARQQEILNRIEQMDDDEAVLTNEGYYHSTIKRHTMSYYEDVTTYTIGLIER